MLYGSGLTLGKSDLKNYCEVCGKSTKSKPKLYVAFCNFILMDVHTQDGKLWM